jgi:hypothetical protein
MSKILNFGKFFCLILMGLCSCMAVVAQKPVVTVTGVIDTNTTWTSANDYLLDGKVYVSGGAKLTIDPGTTIKGKWSATSKAASALVITRGSKIEAVGTIDEPVVFTAANGTKGGWGGLVILGNARVNQPVPLYIEGIDTTTVPPGVDVSYGRNDDTYNSESSGVLSYVRVEYAGASIATDNELNSFTFGGVGCGTQLDHLQAYYGADDGFEWFGGTVGGKYLIATAADDDAFDFDFGYQGCLQFLVSVIDPTQTYSSNPNGIESDNDAGSSGNTPITHPVISNITIVGTVDGKVAGGGVAGYLKDAAELRRNSSFTIVNAIFYGYPNGLHNNSANASFVLHDNVGTAFNANATYLGFSNIDASNDSVAIPADLVLTAPFGNYKTGGLTPSEGPAYDNAVFDPTSLSCCSAESSFVVPVFLGGANDSYGGNWLAYGWVLGLK